MVKTLSGLLIGLLIFMSIMVAFGYLVVDLNDNYNAGLNVSWVNEFDRFNDSDIITDDIRNQVEGSEADTDSQAWASTGILRAVKLPLNSFSMIKDFALLVVDDVLLPHWVFTLFISSSMLTIIFIIVSLITRRNS